MSDEQLYTLKEFLQRRSAPAMVTKSTPKVPNALVTSVTNPPAAFTAALKWVRRNFPQHASYWDRVRLVTEAGIPREIVGDRRRRLQGWFHITEPSDIHVVARDGRDAASYVRTLTHEACHATCFSRHSRQDWDAYKGFEGYAEVEGTDAVYRYRLDQIYEQQRRRNG